MQLSVAAIATYNAACANHPFTICSSHFDVSCQKYNWISLKLCVELSALTSPSSVWPDGLIADGFCNFGL